ncbi:MAG: TetR/AcrR family transcriptional regulator [Pseudomonadota bacterium]|nr:TetR/AcrR family transcriptional regulator [Pseudomonadota bacterium]
MSTNTRQRILETARHMFNEAGTNRVGMRELARALGMSPGNLVYHFPTKDALVAALVAEASNANTLALATPRDTPASLFERYDAIVAVMRNHLHYRFATVGYVDALAGSDELRENERLLNVVRRARFDRFVQALIEAGVLSPSTEGPRRDRLRDQVTVMMRGWLIHAEIQQADDNVDVLIDRYAKLVVAVFEPYCTPLGLAQLATILDDAPGPRHEGQAGGSNATG